MGFSMDRPALMAMVLAILLILLALMFIGWRSRQRRQRALGRPAQVPADPGAELFSAPAFYVATTIAGEPLNRVVVGGLGYRSRAQVNATDLGVILSLPGQEPLFIPAQETVALERATWTIDRVVEQDGMVRLRWRLPSDDAHTEVDSYLRFIEPRDSIDFMAIVTETYLHGTTEGGNAQ